MTIIWTYRLIFKLVIWTGRLMRIRRIKEYLSLRNDQKIQKADVLFHCASLGEYQSIKPLLKSIRLKFSKIKVSVSFFSPSGFKYVDDQHLYDYKIYSPIDKTQEVKNFIDSVCPSLIIISQNEIWPVFLTEIRERNIPFVYVDSYFRPTLINHIWLRLNRKSLTHSSKFFTQNHQTAELLQTLLKVEIENVGSLRVENIEEELAHALPKYDLSAFIQKNPLIIFGSIHKSDWNVLVSTLVQLIGKFKIILAPHEMDQGFFIEMKKSLDATQTSMWTEGIGEGTQVCILDEFGILKYLYKYADIVYIGGGFGSGIHNVMEPAFYQKPIIVGPDMNKFHEALHLEKEQVLFRIRNSKELLDVIENVSGLHSSIKSKYQSIQKASERPSLKVINHIIEKKLLN